jgi:hypothetical protein
MSATPYASYKPAAFAGRDGSECMPSRMPFMCMATAAGTIFPGTDVNTSVPFIAAVLSLGLSLVLIGVLVSLSGLTGRIVLVGLIKETGTGTTRGD